MSLVPTSLSNSSEPNGWSLGGMQFDAWLHLMHSTSLTITQHPVATGANITDHSFVNPNRWTFEVGMSDVFTGPSFVGISTSRSVNAYNALVALQFSRKPQRLITKYGTFNNVLIESVDASDDSRTKYGGRYTINLREIIVVNSPVSTSVSTNPHATDQTNRGQLAGQAPRQDIAQVAKSYLGTIYTSAVKAFNTVRSFF